MKGKTLIKSIAWRGLQRSLTFDDGGAEGHDGADEQPPRLRPFPRDAAVLGGRAEQLLAHVEDELAPRVRDPERSQSERGYTRW